MKKILVTGANSYVGISFENWLRQWPEAYQVDSIGLRGDDWKDHDFSQYDVVYHLAAIVHVKESDSEKYFEVNRDLAFDVAKKAKQSGINQFIFMSTMGVYGCESGYIKPETLPTPKTPYAISKFEAEKLINQLADDHFNVAVLRPPMIYGKDCKGNYPRLADMALKLPCFPKIENERSMLYIDNLCEFVRVVIDQEDSGYFFPQNKEYVNTSELVKTIAEVHGRKICLTRIFNGVIKLLRLKVELLNKVFGSLVYEKSMSEYQVNYQIREFLESIALTELEEER